MKSKAAARRIAVEHSPPRNRIAVGLRVTPETRDDLAERAAKAGTSLTSQIENLLQKAMLFERLAGQEVLNALWDFHSAGAREAAYQGIVDHADDDQVVATAIALLHHVVRDYPHRLQLAQFGYERYFQHRQRTDNCANCMVGDTTQGLAQNLTELYAAAGRYDEAIEVGRRLIEGRSADVSPYKLAETWDRDGKGKIFIGNGSTRFIAPQFDPALQRQPALLDARVRAALTYAIDRKTLSELMQRGHGELAANALLPPGDRLYEAVKDGFSRYAFDPTRARRLLLPDVRREVARVE